MSGFKTVGSFLLRCGMRPWISLAAGGYCVYRAMQHMVRQISLSELKVLTDNKVVQRAIGVGEQIFFRASEGPWYRCNIGPVSSELIMDTICQNPSAQVTVIGDEDLALIVSLGSSVLTQESRWSA